MKTFKILTSLLYIAVAIVGISGCTLDRTNKSGNTINMEQVNKIEKGKTTESEIIGWFGSPQTRTTRNGQNQLMFTSSRIDHQQKITPMIILTGEAHNTTKIQNIVLNVMTKDGVIVDYTVQQTSPNY